MSGIVDAQKPLSKRKRVPADERRRRSLEINLLDHEDGSAGVLVRARRGCAIPFFGGALIAVLVPFLVHMAA